MNSPLSTLQSQISLRSVHPLDPPAFCTTCREKLPLFVTDEWLGAKVDRLYPEVAFHLDICPTCLEEYESLSLLLSSATFVEDAP